MKVKCINDSNVNDITKGKIYTVTWEGNTTYRIYDDHSQDLYSKNRIEICRK